MPVENPKIAAYLKLIEAAESYTFCATTDGIMATGLAYVVATTLTAYEQGLTPAEIANAVKIGEFRGSPQSPKKAVSEPDPTLTPEYWQRVRQEAEEFWLQRYRGEE